MTRDHLSLFVGGYKLSRNGKGTPKSVYYRCNKKSITNEKCKVCYKYNPITEILVARHDEHAGHVTKDIDEMANHILRREMNAYERTKGGPPSKDVVLSFINGSNFDDEIKSQMKAMCKAYTQCLNRQAKKHVSTYL